MLLSGPKVPRAVARSMRRAITTLAFEEIREHNTRPTADDCDVDYDDDDDATFRKQLFLIVISAKL